MAQTPWEVLLDVPIDKIQAAALAESCSRDIRKYSARRPQWQSLVENLSTFAQSVVATQSEITPFNLKHSHISSANRNDKKHHSPTKAGLHPIAGSSSYGHPFSRVVARGAIQLHPCYMQSVRMGVRAYLSNFLLKYLPEFNGVWVAYHPKILRHDSIGFLSDAEKMAIITFEVQIQCLVFRPSPSALLVGTVNQIRDTHITLLVDGIFSACIRRDSLERHYVLADNVYVARDDAYATIRPLSTVAFTVERCRHSSSGEIMTIEGSLNDASLCGVLDPCLKPETVLNPVAFSTPGVKQEVHEQSKDCPPRSAVSQELAKRCATKADRKSVV